MYDCKYYEGAFDVVTVAVTSLTALIACLAVPAQLRSEVSDPLAFFEKEVRPILARHCYECHSSQASTVFGKLRLDSEASMLRGGRSGPVIVPGDPQGSRLIQAVGYESEQLAMPPSGRLAPEAVEALKLWVRLGAPWPEAGESASTSVLDREVPAGQSTGLGSRWREPAVPRTADAAWPRGRIDRFVLCQTRGERSFPLRNRPIPTRSCVG